MIYTFEEDFVPLAMLLSCFLMKSIVGPFEFNSVLHGNLQISLPDLIDDLLFSFHRDCNDLKVDGNPPLVTRLVNFIACRPSEVSKRFGFSAKVQSVRLDREK